MAAQQQLCCWLWRSPCCPCCYVFVHKFLFNPHFDLEHDYIIRKGIRHRIQRYAVRTEILPVFHMSRLSISMSVYPYVAIVKYWTKMPNDARNHARNSPLPLRHVDFHLTHECMGPPHSPRQTASGSNQPCCPSSHVRTDRWYDKCSIPLALRS